MYAGLSKAGGRQRAHRLTLKVFRVTGLYPKEQKYVPVSQTRRAALSVAANIVEGRSRSGPAEFARFLTIASGSAAELEYHLTLACDLGFLPREVHEETHRKVVEVRKMLFALTRRIRAAR